MLDEGGLALRLGYSDSDHAVGTCGNVIITYSRSEPSHKYLSHWTELAQDLLRIHPRGIGVVTVIDGSAPPPSEPMRVAIKRTMLDLGTRVRALALVVEGRGFLAAGKRSALSLVSLVARYPFPDKVFDTVINAAPWVFSRLGDSAPRGFAVANLVTGSSELRAKFEASLPKGQVWEKTSGT